MIKTGMVSVTFREMSSDKIIDICKEAGLSAIEWSENAHVHPNDSEGAKKLRDETLKAGLEVAAYGSYYRLGVNEDYEAVFLDSLASARALGAPIIRIWAGTKPSIEVTRNQMQEMAKETSVICDLAHEAGIKIAFEWHKNTLTDTNESAKEFIEMIDNDNLYCLWQPTVELDETQRCDGIKILGDRMLNYHVYHWVEGKRKPFDEGVDAWTKYFNCANNDKTRYALMEFVKDNSVDQFKQDAKALKMLVASINHS